jgi:hypothetical protein
MTLVSAKVVAVERTGDQYQVVVRIQTKYRGSFNNLAFGENKPFTGTGDWIWSITEIPAWRWTKSFQFGRSSDFRAKTIANGCGSESLPLRTSARMRFASFRAPLLSGRGRFHSYRGLGHVRLSNVFLRAFEVRRRCEEGVLPLDRLCDESAPPSIKTSASDPMRRHDGNWRG